MVQAPCSASAIDPAHLKAFAYKFLGTARDPGVVRAIQQTAACNALHSIEQRACKWLVRMHDLVGYEIPLTQDFLAQMMGWAGRAKRLKRGYTTSAAILTTSP